MRDIVKTKKEHDFGIGDYVAVDTVNTIDCDWETMVFPCSEYGNIISWGKLDVRRYPDKESAIKGHKEMIQKWQEL